MSNLFIRQFKKKKKKKKAKRKQPTAIKVEQQQGFDLFTTAGRRPKKQKQSLDAIVSYLDNGKKEMDERLDPQIDQAATFLKKAKKVTQSGKTAKHTQAYRAAPAPMQIAQKKSIEKADALAEFKRGLRDVIRNNGIERLNGGDEDGDDRQLLQELAMDPKALEQHENPEGLKKKLNACGSEFPAQIIRAEQLVRTREQSMSRPHTQNDAVNYTQTILNRSMSNSPIYSIAVGKGLQLPNLPSLTRRQISEFLKPADETRGEKPCCFGDKCVSMDMARRRKIPHPAPCKEMRLSNLPKPNGEHTKYMCYLCSVYMTTRLYGQNVTGGKSVEAIVQPFQVICGVEGEYHINSILPLPIEVGSKFFGIFAPFPRWDATNYEWHTGRWVESSQLDFHEGAMHH